MAVHQQPTASKHGRTDEKAANVWWFKAICIYLQEKSANHMNMNGMSDTKQATLSSKGDMTSFKFGNYNIRFRTPSRLQRYTEVKEWDNGYIVVIADYEGIGLTEEYIDLLPILENLYIEPQTFLKPIKSVKIEYDE